jgi:hypothetical protein
MHRVKLIYPKVTGVREMFARHKINLGFVYVYVVEKF